MNKSFGTVWARAFGMLALSAFFLIAVCAYAYVTAPHGSRDLPLNVGPGSNHGCVTLVTGEIPGHVLIGFGNGMRLAGPAMVAKTLGKNPPKNVTVFNYCR